MGLTAEDRKWIGDLMDEKITASEERTYRRLKDNALGEVEERGGMPRKSETEKKLTESYYWTKEWQEAEREAMEEYRRGEYVGFASGADAAQWLMAD